MLLLKCCIASWLAFVDPTFPEHPSGRFAKFIPSTVWSLLVECLSWVEEVVDAATRRPFPATSKGLWYGYDVQRLPDSSPSSLCNFIYHSSKSYTYDTNLQMTQCPASPCILFACFPRALHRARVNGRLVRAVIERTCPPRRFAAPCCCVC